MLTILILCVAHTNPEEIVTDQVDYIELNQYYDDKGRYVLDQYIFYRWDRFQSRWECIDWRMANGKYSDELNKKMKAKHDQQWKDIDERPKFNPIITWYFMPVIKYGKYWKIIAVDKHTNTFRKITTPIFQESWTQDDVEIEERDKVPELNRLKLTNTKKIKQNKQTQQ